MSAEDTVSLDYSVVHAVPGHGKRVDYVPGKDDPLFLGKSLPSALSVVDIDESGGAV
jgi:hypothetical protein